MHTCSSSSLFPGTDGKRKGAAGVYSIRMLLGDGTLESWFPVLITYSSYIRSCHHGYAGRINFKGLHVDFYPISNKIGHGYSK